MEIGVFQTGVGFWQVDGKKTLQTRAERESTRVEMEGQEKGRGQAVRRRACRNNLVRSRILGCRGKVKTERA